MMATANPVEPDRRAPRRRSRTLRAALVLAGLLLIALIVFKGGDVLGKARAGTAFGARMACSCHYVAGRSLGQCRDDFEPGMSLVMLGDDPETRTVTARVPLLAHARASFREGWGCQLEPWSD